MMLKHGPQVHCPSRIAFGAGELDYLEFFSLAYDTEVKKVSYTRYHLRCYKYKKRNKRLKDEEDEIGEVAYCKRKRIRQRSGGESLRPESGGAGASVVKCEGGMSVCVESNDSNNPFIRLPMSWERTA